jgi:hypothetical protein
MPPVRGVVLDLIPFYLLEGEEVTIRLSIGFVFVVVRE